MSAVIKHVSHFVEDSVSFSNDVVNNFATTVIGAVTGVVKGTSNVTQTTADIVDMLIHDVAGEHTTRFFKGMGHIAEKLCATLGDVVKPIPIVGSPTAFLVHRAGDTVCHVVVSVGTVAGSVSKRTGQLVKKGADLLVFTLTNSRELLEDVGHVVTDLVSILADGHKKKRTMSQKGGGEENQYQVAQQQQEQRAAVAEQAASRAQATADAKAAEARALKKTADGTLSEYRSSAGKKTYQENIQEIGKQKLNQEAKAATEATDAAYQTSLEAVHNAQGVLLRTEGDKFSVLKLTVEKSLETFKTALDKLNDPETTKKYEGSYEKLQKTVGTMFSNNPKLRAAYNSTLGNVISLEKLKGHTAMLGKTLGEGASAVKEAMEDVYDETVGLLKTFADWCGKNPWIAGAMILAVTAAFSHQFIKKKWDARQTRKNSRAIEPNDNVTEEARVPLAEDGVSPPEEEGVERGATPTLITIANQLSLLQVDIADIRKIVTRKRNRKSRSHSSSRNKRRD
jgi:hypothetical protein